MTAEEFQRIQMQQAVNEAVRDQLVQRARDLATETTNAVPQTARALNANELHNALTELRAARDRAHNQVREVDALTAQAATPIRIITTTGNAPVIDATIEDDPTAWEAIDIPAPVPLNPLPPDWQAQPGSGQPRFVSKETFERGETPI